MDAVRFFILSLVFFVLNATSPSVFADDFRPTMLKIWADEIINYRFGSYNLSIPVAVTGTPCQLVFSIYTKNMADLIEPTTNGFLGWHYVNGVDTCIYYSPPYDFEVGTNEIIWDGRDQDDNLVCPGVYTYYLWAFDNKSEKMPVSLFIPPSHLSIMGIDEEGLPSDKPYFYRREKRWQIGTDPEDESNLIETEFVLEENTHIWQDPWIPRSTQDTMYLPVLLTSPDRLSMRKFRFVPGGTAESFDDWGEEAPYATKVLRNVENGGQYGVASDGDYLYLSTFDRDAGTYLHQYDMQGYLVNTIDITPWWSANYGQRQRSQGITYMHEHDGRFLVSSFIACMVQLIDPARYIKSGDIDDLMVWCNSNGDYVLDFAADEPSMAAYDCYYPPYFEHTHVNTSSDVNGFSTCTFGMSGGPSFGLLGPDGTGIGHFSFADEVGPKDYRSDKVVHILDENTAYDGIYSNIWEWGLFKTASGYMAKQYGMGFVGHDCFKGLIGEFPDIFATDKWIGIRWPAEGMELEAGSQVRIITYTAFVDSLKYEVSFDNGITWNIIVPEVKKRMMSWTVPSVHTGTCLLRATDADDPTVFATSGPFTITGGTVAVEGDAPKAITLSQNSPNPFNPVTSIGITVPKDSHVSLVVYDIGGRKIATLIDGNCSAGQHSVDWNASEFASGIYFCRMEAGGVSETRKMTLLK